MLGKQHLFYGITTSTTIAAVHFFTNTATPDFTSAGLFVLGGIIGSLLPDIDTPNSTLHKLNITILSLIGIIIPVIPKILIKIYKAIIQGFCNIVKHRTYTHDIMFYVLLSFLILKFNITIPVMLLLGLGFGILGHLCMDAMTVHGIPFFYLFNKKKNIHLLPASFKIWSDTGKATVVTVMFSLIVIGGTLFRTDFFNHLL